MIDYNNTIIYKIIHKDNVETEIYIGHTTDFTKRKSSHKSTCYNYSGKNKHSHYRVYEYIRNNGGWNDFIMSEVEKYPCNTKTEAREKEQYWTNFYNSTLNNKKAYSTQDEIKEYYLQYAKQKENIEKRQERDKIYNKKRTGYFKEWYKNNKEDLKTKITCSCGCILNKGSLSRHLKSKQHCQDLH
jgi:hypothetical protein